MGKNKEQETTALAVIDNEIFNLQVIAEGSADLQDNLDQIQIRLPQIKIIHQAQMFEMPNGDKVQSFQGIILDFNKVNSYWKESFDTTGGGTPPDCFSIDGVKPSVQSNEVQANFCAECPQNQFGSEVNQKGEPGRGKACKNIKRVHVVTQTNQLLPYRLTLPPSNQRAFDKYISSLVAQGLPWRMVFTQFGLNKAQNKDGIAYAEITFSPLNTISKEQVAISKEISSRLMIFMRDEVRKEELTS